MRSVKQALFLLAFLCPLANAQFGVIKDTELGKKLHEASIDESGKVDSKFERMARELVSVAPISNDDAMELAVLLEAVQIDPETVAMVSQMKKKKGAGGALQAFIDDVTPLEVVKGMKQALDELKAIEILFADPARAVVEMEKEGLIEKKRVDFYKENPEVLAEDTRTGVYFSFVSLAVAGGYL